MKIPELSWPMQLPSYDDDLLLDISAGTIAILIRGRNAWNSTWVRHYLRNSTLYTDVASAKLGAEGQRGPGNVFYIVEAPALLLRGAQSSVVLCDSHPDNPLGTFTGLGATVTRSAYGDWIGGLFPGVSVRDAVSAFEHNSGHWAGPVPSEHSLRTGRLDGHGFGTPSPAMQAFTSRPAGHRSPLQWDRNPAGSRYSPRGTTQVARGWADILAAAVQGATGGDARAQQLARYRSDVLRALPKSQWLRQKQRIDSERRQAAETAEARWHEALDRVAELEEALEECQIELEAAREARMKPAGTSAGLRAQRQRIEDANLSIARLSVDLADAEAEAEQLFTLYSRRWALGRAD